MSSNDHKILKQIEIDIELARKELEVIFGVQIFTAFASISFIIYEVFFK